MRIWNSGAIQAVQEQLITTDHGQGCFMEHSDIVLAGGSRGRERRPHRPSLGPVDYMKPASACNTLSDDNPGSYSHGLTIYHILTCLFFLLLPPLS